jgi:hypothetical protein
VRLSDWLASWAADGWRPEYPWGGKRVVINGREVLRFALIKDDVDPER